MLDRTAEPVVVKQEPELQEDVPSLDSPESRQVDAGFLGLLLPVKLEPDTDDFIKREIEIEIGPTALYNSETIPTPEFNGSVKEEIMQHDGTLSCGNDDNLDNNYAQDLIIIKLPKLKDCPKELSRKSVSIAHSREKSFSFDNINCHYKGSTKLNLVRHMLTHTEDTPYSCDNCQYKCSRKHYLVRHMRRHTGDKPYSCSECQYKGSRKLSLVRHMRRHTGEKPYSCSKCQYDCSRKQSLVQHMFTHTKEKPFGCSNCQYKCSRKHYLVLHMYTHTGEKQYSCSNSTKQNLIRHMRTHTSEKLYSCNNCKYKGSTKQNLVRHMRTHAKMIYSRLS